MSSKIDICNLALTHLGQKAIADIDDPIETARKLKAIYDNNRDSLLRISSINWNFACVIGSLAEDDVHTVTGWSNIYTYPVSCLKIRKVYSDTGATNPFPEEYKVVNDVTDNVVLIATNIESPAYVEYTRTMTDETKFDPLFVQALAYKLAADLAIPLGGDPDKEKRFNDKYLATLSEAARVNGMETYQNPVKKSYIYDARS